MQEDITDLNIIRTKTDDLVRKMSSTSDTVAFLSSIYKVEYNSNIIYNWALKLIALSINSLEDSISDLRSIAEHVYGAYSINMQKYPASKTDMVIPCSKCGDDIHTSDVYNSLTHTIDNKPVCYHCAYNVMENVEENLFKLFKDEEPIISWDPNNTTLLLLCNNNNMTRYESDALLESIATFTANEGARSIVWFTRDISRGIFVGINT